MTDAKLTNGPYGFAWGPVEVERTAEVDGYVYLTLHTDHKQRALGISVSPTGRVVRVFRDGQELDTDD